jgi:hypothetical protein
MRLNGHSEKWLEDQLAKGLLARGLASFHMSDPTKPGIPDRYVLGCGGLWIEVKQGATPRELARGFDRQRTFMTKLMRNKERPFICALHQPNSYTVPSLYLEPWQHWLRREDFMKKAYSGDAWAAPSGPAWCSPWHLDRMEVFDAALDNFVKMVRK